MFSSKNPIYRYLSSLCLPLICCVPTHAGSIEGTVTSSKDVDEEKSAAVIWLEGVPASSELGNKPTISQTGIQFVPRVLTVVAGQTVHFPNDDDVSHNVFSMSKAKKFKLGIYPKGESKEVTFEKPGVIDLFCSIHRHMHAVIVVAPSEHFAQTELKKKYRVENIPAGTYTVHIWNAAHKQVSKQVTVTDQGTTTLDVLLED